MKFKKLPIEIEAVVYNKDKIADTLDFVPQDIIFFNPDENDYYIRTLEGDHKCTEGDYIIRGVNGEFYPCKPDIFEKTYETVKPKPESEPKTESVKPINIKKIKKMCMVRGCKNKNTFTISKVRDFGDTVLICPDCLKEAIEAIEYFEEHGVPKETELPKEPSPLFYNHLINSENNDLESQGDDETDDDENKFTCPKCEKEYKSKSGLIKHEKTCPGV